MLLAYFIVLCKNSIRKEDIHMVKNRIRELRKSLNMSQEMLAEKIRTTQQAVSRMENNAYDIPSDILIEISKQFNVTTDYILGISDVKRDYNGQYRMNQEMDKCYDIVLRYQKLSKINQKTLRCVLERLEQAQMESSERPAKEVDFNAENSNM
jgi:transcriptional regulator with XRE-family HTH domain